MFQDMVRALTGVVERVRGVRVISTHVLDEVSVSVQQALLDADVPRTVVDQIIAGIREKLQAPLPAGVRARPHDRVAQALSHQLRDLLGEAGSVFQWTGSLKSGIVVGLQGAGKTTTLIKLAVQIMRERAERKSQRPLLVASVDFGRPAARQQLTVLAAKAGIPCYEAQARDPRAAAREIVHEAHRRNADLLLDTAGRLHTDDALAQELADVVRIVQPDERILVLDGMMGQAAFGVAQTFHRNVQVTGGIITKLDGDTRGGVVLAFRAVVGQPIVAIGTGEHADDLERFQPDRFIKRLLGEGDIATFIERAEVRLGVDQPEDTSPEMFTLAEFKKQLGMIQRLGSLSSLLSYMPGLGSMKISAAQLAKGEKAFQRYGYIIDSMTRKERLRPALVNASRRERIARGAGVAPAEVGELISTFEQMKQFVRLMDGGRPKGR